MNDFPKDLYDDCYKVLLYCSEFESNESLSALFVTHGLQVYCKKIPQANSVERRVSLLLAYLIQRPPGSSYVLVNFLEVLRAHYHEEDDLGKDIDALILRTRDVLAMNAPGLAVVHPGCRSRHQHRADEALYRNIVLGLLLEIDFQDQINLVREILREQRVAAFLVHGHPGHGRDSGQDAVVRSLFYLYPDWNNSKCIFIDVGSRGLGSSVTSLWAELSREFGAPASARPAQIIDRIYKSWQTQHVIFVLKTAEYLVNRARPTFLSEWLREFWQALAQKASMERDQEHHLVLFLVDYQGRITNSDVHFAKSWSDSTVPLALPPAIPFPMGILENWLRKPSVVELLHHSLTAQALWERSSGIPLQVFRVICDHCSLDWEGDVSRWLTY